MQDFEKNFKRFNGGSQNQVPQTPPTPPTQQQGYGYQQPQGYEYPPQQPQTPTKMENVQPQINDVPSDAVVMEKKSFKGEVANCMLEKNISDSILKSVDKLVENASLVIPKGYNVANELKTAYYAINKVDGWQNCTQMSIANALTETAIQGLSASAKQCYYIKYGNNIEMQRSYFGDVALVKRTGLVKDVFAVVIYDGDEIETGFDEYGMECVKKHVTKFGNQDNPIIGAYAVAVGVNGYKRYCIMTKRQLDNNWSLSKSKDNSKFLRDFPEEASKRTAIRRLVKMILNTAIDTSEYQQQIIGSYERTLETEYADEDSKFKNVDDMRNVVESYGNVVEVEDDL